MNLNPASEAEGGGRYPAPFALNSKQGVPKGDARMKHSSSAAEGGQATWNSRGTHVRVKSALSCHYDLKKEMRKVWKTKRL
jgi:hypothetical protein